MRQLAYFSTASGHQDAIVVSAILATSREQNRRHGISGLLVAGGHRYLQVIEGPSAAIGTLIDNICRDPRHLSVNILYDQSVTQRSFEGWSMAYRQVPELREFATFRDLVDRMGETVSDLRLRGKIRRFGQAFATSGELASRSPWPSMAS